MSPLGDLFLLYTIPEFQSGHLLCVPWVGTQQVYSSFTLTLMVQPFGVPGSGRRDPLGQLLNDS